MFVNAFVGYYGFFFGSHSYFDFIKMFVAVVSKALTEKKRDIKYTADN